MDDLSAKLKINVAHENAPEGAWFGWADYGKSEVVAYSRNPSCQPVADLLADMKAKGASRGVLAAAAVIMRLVPRSELFELFNQSGMDHEVVGHLLNAELGRDHGESAAVAAQVELARKRAKDGFSVWALILPSMERILFAHKGREIAVESKWQSTGQLTEWGCLVAQPAEARTAREPNASIGAANRSMDCARADSTNAQIGP